MTAATPFSRGKAFKSCQTLFQSCLRFQVSKRPCFRQGEGASILPEFDGYSPFSSIHWHPTLFHALFPSLPSGPGVFLACAFLGTRVLFHQFASAHFFLRCGYFLRFPAFIIKIIVHGRMSPTLRSFGVLHCYPLSYRSQ